MLGKRAPFIALPDANGNLYELPLGQKVSLACFDVRLGRIELGRLTETSAWDFRPSPCMFSLGRAVPYARKRSVLAPKLVDDDLSERP